MNHKEMIFKIGDKVKIKSDYQNGYEGDHRALEAVIIGHVVDLEPSCGVGESVSESHYVDNLVRFPCGTVEPFANWELEVSK